MAVDRPRSASRRANVREKGVGVISVLHQGMVTPPLMLIPAHRTEVLWLVANLPALTFVFIFMSISFQPRFLAATSNSEK